MQSNGMDVMGTPIDTHVAGQKRRVALSDKGFFHEPLAVQQRHDADHVNRVAQLLFHRVDEEQVRRMQAMFETEPLISIVFEIASASLVGGGVVFSRDGHVLEEYARSFYSETWSKFARDVVYGLWSYGFVGVVLEHHPQFRAVPRVLDMSMVDVSVHKLISGRNEYVFYPKQAQMPDMPFPLDMGPGASSSRTPIPGVIVFDDQHTSPDAHGNLRSKLYVVSKIKDMLMHNIQAQVMAAARMADPPLVLQKRAQVFSQSRAVADSASGASGSAGVLARVSEDASEAELSSPNALAEQYFRNQGMNVVVRDSQSFHSDGLGHVPSVLPTEFVRKKMDHRGIEYNNPDPSGTVRALYAAHGDNAPLTQRICAADDVEVKGHTAAQEPRHLIELKLGYEEQVASMFGVPRSYFAQFSAGKSAQSPDGREMFEQMKRRLKQLITPILRDVFNAIYRNSLAFNYVATCNELTLDTLNQKTQIEVSLPGIPDREVMLQLYQMGLLKHTAYRAYVAQSDGIALTDMNEKQLLSVYDMNGIEDPARVEQQQQMQMQQGAKDASDTKQNSRETMTERTKVNPETGETVKTVVKVTEGVVKNASSSSTRSGLPSAPSGSGGGSKRQALTLPSNNNNNTQKSKTPQDGPLKKKPKKATAK